MIKVREEVARVFQPITIVDLEKTFLLADHPAHQACLLALTDLFKIPLVTVERFVSRRLSSPILRDEARAFYKDDTDFRNRCEQVQKALASVDADILPKAVLRTFTPAEKQKDDMTYGTMLDAIAMHHMPSRWGPRYRTYYNWPETR